MNKTIGTADIKARLSEFISRVRFNKERIVIARRGKPIVALISLEDLARLEALDREAAARNGHTHPIMDAFGAWRSRDDLDELVDEIYADRNRSTGRNFEL